MVIKMVNKDENFYQYMGKFFGSRVVQKQTNDRIFDDDDKEWYIYIEDNRVLAFVSINNNVIKNVYTAKEKYLEEVLKKVKEENEIRYSVVTNYYAGVYERAGFKVNKNQSYKNFVTIYTEKQAAMLID